MKKISIRRVIFLLLFFTSLFFNIICYYRLNNQLKEKDKMKETLFYIEKDYNVSKTLTKNGNSFKTQHYKERLEIFNLENNKKEGIVFLGDSLTEYCNWEKRFKNKKIINHGIAGDTTDGILKRISYTTKLKPEKVFIMIGVNDLLCGVSGQDVIRNYEKIISKIKKDSNETTIIVQSNLPVKEAAYGSINNRIIQMNNYMKKYSEKERIIYIDMFSLFSDKKGEINTDLSQDGLHLNERGYNLWQKNIEKFIE